MLVAHRGFRSPSGENRMIDFEFALEYCKAVEFDIRMTKDKKIIIFHDHNFNRIGNVNKTVRSLTYEQIKNIDFFKNNKDFLPPLFVEDFVKKLSSKYKMINVEIKPDRYTDTEFSDILNALNILSENTNSEIIVSSFGKSALNFISKLDSKKFKKGYLIERLSEIDYDLLAKFDYLHPYLGVIKLKSNFDKIIKINMPLNVWTFKKDEDVKIINSMYKKLINAYISDYKDLDTDL